MGEKATMERRDLKVQVTDREDLDTLHILMISERLAVRYYYQRGDVSREPSAT